MEGVAFKLVGLILGGGPNALAALLALFIVALLVERLCLTKAIAAMDERYDEIVEETAKGHKALAVAMIALRDEIDRNW